MPIEEIVGSHAPSPVIRVASGVLEVQRSLRTLQGMPVRQAWATLATAAGREYLPDERRGRPRRVDEPLHDPLHLGIAYAPDDITVRLAMVAELLGQSTAAPALVVAAIVHGELLALQPFGAGNGVVARAYTHVLLAERGVDPDFLAMTDVGLVSLGRAAYVRMIRAYDEGTVSGIADWCIHVATASERGALLARAALDEISARA